MTFTSYEVDNDRKFRDALKEASKVVTDFRIPFGLISADFYRSQQAIFKLKGPGQYPKFQGPTISQMWKDPGRPDKRTRASFGDKTAYQARKMKKYGFDYPLMVASGALSASLLGPNNRGSINIVTNLSLILGTSIAYVIYHQSDAPRGKMPLRKVLFIGPEASQFATSEQMGRLQRWLSIIDDWHKKQLKKAGL
jgi:hypothetical protein